MQSEDVLTLLTGALVIITAYYAWQNHRMVKEMREARRLSVLPKLAISIFMHGPTFGMPRLVNVGQGPALDVDINLVFSRRDGSGVEERTWKAGVMPPGETHDFMPPLFGVGGLPPGAALALTHEGSPLEPARLPRGAAPTTRRCLPV